MIHVIESDTWLAKMNNSSILESSSVQVGFFDMTYQQKNLSLFVIDKQFFGQNVEIKTCNLHRLNGHFVSINIKNKSAKIDVYFLKKSIYK